MAKELSPARALWEGIAAAVQRLIKALALAAALYILFPPFWDALFAARLSALHEAPYRAADRAVHLWHLMTTVWSGQASPHGSDSDGQVAGKR